MATPPTYLVGQRFGQLTVLDVRWANEGSHKKPVYKALCRCDCGVEKEVFVTGVRYGHTKSCGCARGTLGRRAGSKCSRFKGHGEIGLCLWNRCRNNASTRSIPFEVTIEYAWAAYVGQRGVCAVSGRPIKLAGSTRDATGVIHNTASLDRIDPNRGYVEGNVQWVHKVVNLMRRELTVEEFVGWCQRVRDHHDPSSPHADIGSTSRTPGIYDSRSGPRSALFKGHGEIGASLWNRYQQHARERGRPFEITIEYGWDTYIAQDRRCALSGVEIEFGSLKRTPSAWRPCTASLDRIDPNKGYVEGNVQWVHKRVNFLRNVLPVEEFISWCAAIADYRQ